MKNLQDMFDTAHVRSYIDKSNELSPETKKRIGTKTKKLWKKKEYRNRVVSGCRNKAIEQHKTMSDAMRKQRSANMSKANKLLWQDPEFRKMMREKQRAGWEAKRKREGRGPSKATLWKRRVAAGDTNRVKKKVSTPYGIFDSVMDMHRAKVCKLQPRTIRLRLYDDKFPDWKYI